MHERRAMGGPLWACRCSFGMRRSSQSNSQQGERQNRQFCQDMPESLIASSMLQWKVAFASRPLLDFILRLHTDHATCEHDYEYAMNVGLPKKLLQLKTYQLQIHEERLSERFPSCAHTGQPFPERGCTYVYAPQCCWQVRQI